MGTKLDPVPRGSARGHRAMTTLAAAALCTAAAALWGYGTLATRRRARRRTGGLVLATSPGARSLAQHVGTSSGLGMGLRLPSPGEGWRRLGTLIGLD